MAQVRLDILLHAMDKATPALVKVRDALKSGEAAAKSFGDKFGPALATAKKVGLAVVAGATAAGTALVASARAAGEYGGQIFDATRRTGMAAEELTALRYAAEQSGVSFEDLVPSLNKLQRSISDAASGSKPMQKAFADLGVSITDANGKLRPTQAVFKDLATAIAAIPDEAVRADVAMTLFGRSGAALLPMLMETGSGIDKLTTQARELGLTITDEMAAKMDEAGDRMDAAGEMMRATWRMVGAEVAPVIADIAMLLAEKVKPALEEAMRWTKDLIKVMKEWASTDLKQWLRDVRDGLERVGVPMRLLIWLAERLADWFRGKVDIPTVPEDAGTNAEEAAAAAGEYAGAAGDAAEASKDLADAMAEEGRTARQTGWDIKDATDAVVDAYADRADAVQESIDKAKSAEQRFRDEVAKTAKAISDAQKAGQARIDAAQRRLEDARGRIAEETMTPEQREAARKEKLRQEVADAEKALAEAQDAARTDLQAARDEQKERLSEAWTEMSRAKADAAAAVVRADQRIAKAEEALARVQVKAAEAVEAAAKKVQAATGGAEGSNAQDTGQVLFELPAMPGVGEALQAMLNARLRAAGNAARHAPPPSGPVAGIIRPPLMDTVIPMRQAGAMQPGGPLVTRHEVTFKLSSDPETARLMLGNPAARDQICRTIADVARMLQPQWG